MIAVPGYEIEQTLYRGPSTLLLRGRRLNDQQSFILKLPTGNTPTVEELSRLKNEYEILGDKDIPGTVRICALIKQETRPMLVFCDTHGISVAEHLRASKGKPAFDTASFLDIAVQLAHALAAIHQHRIVHNDLKPSNFILNAQTGDVRITDFGSATTLARQDASTLGTVSSGVSLPYMSPEQTGRMNRPVDHRTDLYSLGVSLYEMLTGTLPFALDDPMSLVHAHIARKPKAPCAVDPRIPRQLSDIIVKLLEKAAEHRYQSAFGLASDLQRCRDEWARDGQISAFALAQHDLLHSLQIPPKLYGREREVERLVTTFGDMCDAGQAMVVLVAGYSGVGKTALIQELHKPTVARHGHFVVGKFDQFSRETPYSALLYALSQLVEHIAGEGAEAIHRWRERLHTALGANGQVVVDVIPQLEQLVGPQPPVPDLGPSESANRFDRVFGALIATFAQAEEPLTIVLDDLQWADEASLRLLRMFASSPRPQSLLLVGAYRDNEVGPEHPLLRSVNDVTAAGGKLDTIELAPLQVAHVSTLLAESLRRSEQEVAPLAELLSKRSVGNPFFLRQLLTVLEEQSILQPDLQRGYWAWDPGKLEAASLANDVLELMLSKMHQLDPSTQNMLRLAACIGNTFSLSTLAIVCGQDITDTLAQLWGAVTAGLVLPIGSAQTIVGGSSLGRAFDQAIADPRLRDRELRAEYRFLHDQVQRAAYALISAEERKPVHLQIGRLLRDERSDDDLFDVVHHLNLGARLIDNDDERTDLAQLNLSAALRAKQATAYQAARRYAEAGLAALGEDSASSAFNTVPGDSNVTDLHELAMALGTEQADCAFLCGDFRGAERGYQKLLASSSGEIEKARIHAKRLAIPLSEHRLVDALELGREALASLGIELNCDPTEQQWQTNDSVTRELLGDRPIEDLINGPRIDNARMEAALDILLGLHPASY